MSKLRVENTQLVDRIVEEKTKAVDEMNKMNSMLLDLERRLKAAVRVGCRCNTSFPGLMSPLLLSAALHFDKSLTIPSHTPTVDDDAHRKRKAQAAVRRPLRVRQAAHRPAVAALVRLSMTTC